MVTTRRSHVSSALLKRCTSKGYRGFESLPHRSFSPRKALQDLIGARLNQSRIWSFCFARLRTLTHQNEENLVEFLVERLIGPSPPRRDGDQAPRRGSNPPCL